MTVTKLPSPVTENIPPVPKYQVDDPIVWTIEDILPVVEACSLYEEIRILGERNDDVDEMEARTSSWTVDEVHLEYDMTEQESCGFLVYAYPYSQWQYLESVIDNLAVNLVIRKNIINSLNERMIKRHQLTEDGYDKTMKDLTELGTVKKKEGFWSSLFN